MKKVKKLLPYITLTAIVVLFIALSPYSKNTKISKTPKDTRVASTEGITPGKSTTTDLKVFGEPRSSESKEDITTYEFGPEKSPTPVVAVVKKDIVIFLKKYPTKKDPTTLNYYINLFGKPELKLFEKEPGQLVYVFLTKGVSITVDDSERSNVYELRYFEPTNEDIFIKTWGNDLLKEEPPIPDLYY